MGRSIGSWKPRSPNALVARLCRFHGQTRLWRRAHRQRVRWARFALPTLQEWGELVAGADVAHRVHGLAVEAHFIVEMWPGRAASAADTPDHGVLGDDLTDLDEDRTEVPVARGHAVAVVDLDHFAVTARAVGSDHGPVRGSAHGIAGRRAGLSGRTH